MTSSTCDALCDEASVVEREGQREHALALYERALAVNANHYRSLLLGANLLTAWGRWQEATHWAERAFSADKNDFAKTLLVEALIKEAMGAAEGQNNTIDFARLVWIGARLIQLGETVRAQAVLEFVQGTAGQDAARMAMLCLLSMKSSSASVKQIMAAWLEEGLTHDAESYVPVEVLLGFCGLVVSMGSHHELTYLNVPKASGALVSVALGSDARNFAAPGLTPQPAFRPAVTQAIALALEEDTLGSAGVFYEWMKDESALDFGVYGGRGTPSVDRVIAGGLISYPVLDFSPASAGRHGSKVQALEYLLTCLHIAGKTPATRFLIISLTLALSRWYGRRNRFDLSLEVVEAALPMAPYAFHLKAAQFTARARLNGETISPRFDKFVGEDSGHLKKFICRYPFTRLDIDQGGGARLCCAHWLPNHVGSVMQDDPITIMNSPMSKKIKRSILEGDYRYCNHLDCIEMVGEMIPTREQIGEATLTQWSRVDHETTHIEQFLFAFDQSCNLSCPSCRRDKIVEKASLSQKKMEVIENKIGPMLKGLKQLDINPAGELFASKLARRTLALVDPTANPDLAIHIISNGTLFNESNWNDIANVHPLVRSVRISVDGCTKGTFEKLRRLANWEEFIDNMKFLRQLRRDNKIHYLAYSFTYQVDNFREMEDFVHFTREMGCDIAIFEKLQNMGAFDLEEYTARAVHRPNHPMLPEYLAMISRDIFYGPGVQRDFEPPSDRMQAKLLLAATA